MNATRSNSSQEPEYDVAFQGARGAFSEEAALHFAGAGARLLACARFQDVFEAVRSGRARGGVAPIENTLAGSVHACYDLLSEYELTIAAELVLHISHCLIAAPGVTLQDVREVRSHPVALAQCEGFFRRHPEMKPVSVFDTAGAVETVLRERSPHAAAIAARRAATIHGGVILAEAIQDHDENYTRFLLVTKEPLECGSTGEQSEFKTTILFKVKNAPGTLHKALGPFAERGIDLAKLESRPLRGAPFEYLFYLDLIGRRDDPFVSEALEELRRITLSLRVLGTYPRSTIPTSRMTPEQ